VTHERDSRSNQTLPTPTTADEWIAVMVDRLVREFQPLQIILFGSRARGDARPDSDVDLLVVLPEIENHHEMMVAMLQELRDVPMGKDVIPTTPDEIARRGHIVGTILRPALRDGKVLYQRP
jgi:uncharacterized protein